MEKERKKRKLDPQLMQRLYSGDEMTVLKALGDLRSSGNLDYIPELLTLLQRSETDNISKEIVTFLADIKQKSVIHYFIEGLKNPELQNVHSEIASACWQSGMDYSPYIDLFIEIFLESDYMTSLESFSVIEQSLEFLSTAEILEKRALILSGLQKVSTEKKPLARELINMMET